MSIFYPVNQAATKPGNGYFNYAVGFFEPEQGPFITTGSAYTASFQASLYIVYANPELPSGSIIEIEVPKQGGLSISTNTLEYAPAFEFIRTDNNPDLIIRLVTNTSSAGFISGSLMTTASYYDLSGSSYNSMVYSYQSNPPPGQVSYIVLEKSALPNL